MSGVTLFMPFLLTIFLETRKKLQFLSKNGEEVLPKMKKFVLKNSETRFQNAETRFQNAKTALSRIFFARTWMDSAQKKPAESSL